MLLVAAPPILAAALHLHGGSLAVFTLAPSLPIVGASVEIRPAELARHDRGSRVTVLIEAPDGAFDVRKVVPASIRLCLDGPLCDLGAVGDGRLDVGDTDHDGIRDLEVTFSRASVVALVANVAVPTEVTFVVSAVLAGGTALSGTETLEIVDHGICGDQPGSSPEPSGSDEVVSPSPSPSPGEPSAEPEPSIVPAPTPTESAPPANEPPQPSEEPPPTPDPSGVPTIEPTPAPTPEPTPVATTPPTPSPPTPEPDPTPDPVAAPAPSPSPGEGEP